MTDENYPAPTPPEYESIRDGEFNILRSVCEKLHKTPLEYIKAISENIPKGGIAVHGGTQSKAESIRVSGFLRSLSSNREWPTYYIASQETSPTNQNEWKQKLRDFAYAANYAAQWGINRGLAGSDQYNFSFYRLPYTYGDLQKYFAGGDTSEIDKKIAMDFPSVVLFKSDDGFRLNKRRVDTDMEKRDPKVHAKIYEDRLNIESYFVAASVSLDKSDLSRAWDNGLLLVEKVRPAISSLSSAQESEHFRNTQLGTLGLNIEEEKIVREALFGPKEYFDAISIPNCLQEIHMQAYFSTARRLLVEKVGLMVYEQYGEKKKSYTPLSFGS